MKLLIFKDKLVRVWKKFGKYHKNSYWKPGEYQYCQQGKRILCKEDKDSGLYFNAITGKEVVLTKGVTVQTLW